MKVYSFPRGGIAFEDPAVPPKNSSVMAFLPVVSVIPLVQHTGCRALPLVSIGDPVKEGMLIGRAQGPGSAHIHATVPGQVVRMVSWEMAPGITNDALVIHMGGEFEKLGKEEKVFSWEGLMPSALQQLMTDYGIVEMEGSGQPVTELLASSHTYSSETPITLVVRCVFDDPWLVADYVLCRERLKAVVEGSIILCRSGQINHIVYAVSHREKDLGSLLLAEAETYDIPASLVLVGSRYPQKNPQELELVLRNYEMQRGLTLGSLLILGPATLAAVHDAVTLKKPILDRYVAVGGSAVKNPQVMKVRIGTRIGDLFDECGGFVGEPQRIVMGSPLSGRRVMDLDEPVVKTSYAVFALLERKTGGTMRQNCIGCGDCRTVCPLGLDPETLFKGIKRRKSGEILESAGGCHGCGCCDLVCPSRLPLSRVIVTGTLRE